MPLAPRGKTAKLATFDLKNEPKIRTVVHSPVRRLLHKLFHRPAVRFGLARDSRSPLRNARFVSFLAESNRKTIDTDFQDAVLRGRRLFKQGLIVALAAGGAWIVIESAKALSMF
jgi:hypothetical protein